MIMINKLEDLFKKCYEMEREYQRQWSGLDSTEIDYEKIDAFKYGVIMYLYNKNDPLLFELININYSYQQLYKLICREIDRENGKAHINPSGCSMPYVHVKISYPIDGENLVKWYRNFNSYRLETLENESEDRVFSILYIDLSYAEYSSKRKLDEDKKQPHIHELYPEIDDKDFKNWNLIPVGSFRKLEALDPPRLYDSNKRTTLLVDIPKPLVEVLIELQKVKLIGKLSVRCKDSGIFSGNITTQIIQEEVEKGRLFSLSESTWYGVSKLYDSKEYNNQLWVKKDGAEWTFEELCEDFTVEDESIVTQMVHLRYVGDTIEHIDYEKIYYTPNEYIQRTRTNKMSIEGTAQPRRKFFKINEASIPFDYPCTVLTKTDNGYGKISCPFILFVLNCFFQHKDLLNEYFNDWIQLQNT